MRTAYLPMLIFLFSLLLCNSPLPDAAITVVPGWHTYVLAPYALVAIVISVILALCTIVYGVLGYQKRISFKVFFLHFLFSLPVLLWMRFGSLLIPARFRNDLNAFLWFAGMISLLFIAAQVLFGIYAGKALLKGRQ